MVFGVLPLLSTPEFRCITGPFRFSLPSIVLIQLTSRPYSWQEMPSASMSCSRNTYLFIISSFRLPFIRGLTDFLKWDIQPKRSTKVWQIITNANKIFQNSFNYLKIRAIKLNEFRFWGSFCGFFS